MPDHQEFKVGYKRPPQHSRFKRGQSGNPAGRPKGALNIETDLKQELSERIAIREGDRSLKVSKQRALLKAMMAKALKGDTRAAGIVLQLIAKIAPPEEEIAGQEHQQLSESEAAILERFIARRLSDKNKQPEQHNTEERNSKNE
jgi:hypothetical protein